MIEGPRAATAAELAAVVALANTVFGSNGKVDMGAAFPALFNPENLSNLRICLVDGAPVSLVGQAVRDVEIGGARLRVASIGSVCTLEDYRGQGLAGRLMEDAVAAARAQGAVIILVSGWRGLYRRMGCIDAGFFRTVLVDRRSRVPRMHLQVRQWTPADVEAMAALQRAERVRWVRGTEEARVLLAAGWIFARPGRTWVVLAKGKVVAWMAATDPVRPEDQDALAVREISGSRVAALAALPRVLGDAKVPRARVDGVASDTELEAAAAAFGLASEIRGFPGTVKIIDPAGLLRSLEPWIAERLEASERDAFRVEAGARTTFRFRDQALSVESVEDLAALVFGSVERTCPPGPPGPLAQVLARVFPVPLPGYGLNYI